MTDDRFEDLMRDAKKTYRSPPNPDFDAMWESIEAGHFGGAIGTTHLRARPRGARMPAAQWIGIAATLVVGIGIGRLSLRLDHSAPAGPAVVANTAGIDKAPDGRDIAFLKLFHVIAHGHHAAHDFVAGNAGINGGHDVLPLVTHLVQIRMAHATVENFDLYILRTRGAPPNRNRAEFSGRARRRVGLRC